MAKEGYINLLPVQYKRSRDPGDSAEMMQARRAFLDAGHYQPLRDAIVAQLRGCLNEHATAVLDIGCGEGYYTHAFADALPVVTTFGLDVSKVAIKAAAKRYKQVTFLCRFQPPSAFCRCQYGCHYSHLRAMQSRRVSACRQTGRVGNYRYSGPRHLMELKGLIYDEVLLHAPILNNWKVLHYSRAMNCGIRCVFAAMKLLHCCR